MSSTRIRNITGASLCTIAILLFAYAVIAGQKTSEPEMTGHIKADAATFTSGTVGIWNIMMTIGDGGTGLYKAVLVGDPSLKTHTIFRPKDLSQFGGKNLLPIVAWGNGGCANRSDDWRNLLSEVASHGFIVISIGPVRATMAIAQNQDTTTTSQMLDAIDWAIQQNGNPDSIYYKKIDTSKIAVMGMSCGGKQALAASLDPRITTTIVWNSGAYPNDFPVPKPQLEDQHQGMPPGGATPKDEKAAAPPAGGLPEIAFNKDDLQKIHAPILYITGTKDFFYSVAKDDFSRITKVPVVLATKEGAEHYQATIYRAPNGGEYGAYGSAWLKWQLKGDKEAAKVFKGKGCGICKDITWSVQKKNID